MHHGQFTKKKKLMHLNRCFENISDIMAFNCYIYFSIFLLNRFVCGLLQARCFKLLYTINCLGRQIKEKASKNT